MAEIFKDLFNKLYTNIKKHYELIDIHMNDTYYHKYQVKYILILNLKKDALII